MQAAFSPSSGVATNPFIYDDYELQIPNEPIIKNNFPPTSPIMNESTQLEIEIIEEIINSPTLSDVEPIDEEILELPASNIFETPESIFETPEAIFETPEPMFETPESIFEPPESIVISEIPNVLEQTETDGQILDNHITLPEPLCPLLVQVKPPRPPPPKSLPVRDTVSDIVHEFATVEVVGGVCLSNGSSGVIVPDIPLIYPGATQTLGSFTGGSTSY